MQDYRAISYNAHDSLKSDMNGKANYIQNAA